MLLSLNRYCWASVDYLFLHWQCFASCPFIWILRLYTTLTQMRFPFHEWNVSLLPIPDRHDQLFKILFSDKQTLNAGTYVTKVENIF